MIIRGVFVPFELTPALAKLTQNGARVQRAQEGWAASAAVAAILDELAAVARVAAAQGMSADVRSASTFADISPGSEAPGRGGDGERSLSAADVAAILGLDPRHVRRLAAGGDLPATKGAHGYRFARKDVDEYRRTRSA